MTPLLCAAREGHVDVVHALLEARADINWSENVSELLLFYFKKFSFIGILVESCMMGK